MEYKIIELIMKTPIVLLIAIATWILTYIVKYPIKLLTKKIKDEALRKRVNKVIVLLPFIIAFAIVFVRNGILTKEWLKDIENLIAIAISSAVVAITIYNFFEGVRGKKTEYETTEEGKAIYNLLLVYARDKEKVKLLLDQC